MTSAYFNGIENAIVLNLQKSLKQIKVAVAWFTNPLLGKLNLAKTDLLKALNKYQLTPKPQQDIHILRKIKQTLKDIEKSV